MTTVQYVVDTDLCNGCCECMSACTYNNICLVMNIKLGHPIPYIDEATCTYCGECLDVCSTILSDT